MRNRTEYLSEKNLRQSGSLILEGLYQSLISIWDQEKELGRTALELFRDISNKTVQDLFTKAAGAGSRPIVEFLFSQRPANLLPHGRDYEALFAAVSNDQANIIVFLLTECSLSLSVHQALFLRMFMTDGGIRHKTLVALSREKLQVCFPLLKSALEDGRYNNLKRRRFLQLCLSGQIEAVSIFLEEIIEKEFVAPLLLILGYLKEVVIFNTEIFNLLLSSSKIGKDCIISSELQNTWLNVALKKEHPETFKHLFEKYYFSNVCSIHKLAFTYNRLSFFQKSSPSPSVLECIEELKFNCYKRAFEHYKEKIWLAGTFFDKDIRGVLLKKWGKLITMELDTQTITPTASLSL
jgi:hypothetical protein